MTEIKKVDLRESETTDTFIERLQQASNELGSIKSSFSKGMEDLGKIQSMLNLDGLNNMDRMIRSFEDRLSEAERRREEAVEGARRYSMELEKEKDRLVKLWDAYKNQEETSSTQEKRIAELEDKLRNTEQVRMQFEQDANARIRTLTLRLEEKGKEVQQLDELKQQVMTFENIRTKLEENVKCMHNDLSAKDKAIESLEKQVQELRGYEQFAPFKAKFEEVSSEYEKEKERLMKLFRLYEETEAENKTLKEEVSNWQSWFNQNQELFTKLLTSVEHLKQRSSPPASTTTVDEEVEIPPDFAAQKNPTEKTKRKLLFRK